MNQTNLTTMLTLMTKINKCVKVREQCLTILRLERDPQVLLNCRTTSRNGKSKHQFSPSQCSLVVGWGNMYLEALTFVGGTVPRRQIGCLERIEIKLFN